MALSSSFDQSNRLNINEKNVKQEYKITNEICEVSTGEEVDCNLQTPLMFSRCSSLGSLSGFEQHSIQDDRNSVVSECSSKTSRPASPAIKQNETLEIPCKSYSSHKIDNVQEKILYNSAFTERKVNSCERISLYTNVSFQYDIAFKKPHFLKHSVFEDDIAAFKDESSPNLLSTAASSLSSLTIDDDDYNDNSLPNKAGLVKKRINSTNTLQNTHYREHCRHNSVGSASEPDHIAKANIKSVTNQFDYKSTIHSNEKSFTQGNFNKDASNYKEQKMPWNFKSQYSNNLQDNVLRNNKSDSIKNEFQYRVLEKDKFTNTLQDNEELFKYCKTELKSELNNEHNKDGTYEKYKNEKLELKEKRKVFVDCYKSSKEQSNYIEENSDLNAYEEQLLDQCIRRGMAKVTKQKMTDIKPFCWDLNHICLTTRANLKIRDEEIIRDRNYERSRRRISQKSLPIRYAINSRTK